MLNEKEKNKPLTMLAFFDTLCFIAIFIGFIVVFFKFGVPGVLAALASGYLGIMLVILFFFLYGEDSQYAWHIALIMALGILYCILFKFHTQKTTVDEERFVLYVSGCFFLFYVLIKHEPYMYYVNNKQICIQSDLNPLRIVFCGIIVIIAIVNYPFLLHISREGFKSSISKINIADLVLLFANLGYIASYISYKRYAYHISVGLLLLTLTYLFFSPNIFQEYDSWGAQPSIVVACIIFIIISYRKQVEYFDFLDKKRALLS